MKTIFSILLLVHGLIHFMGFAKAFHFAKIEQLTKAISKPLGTLWLLTGLLFIISAIIYLMKKDLWPILVIVAVVLSQLLIFMFWKDAKFGTLANVILLTAAIIGFAIDRFENNYQKGVEAGMKNIQSKTETVTEKDLEHLPSLVQNYLKYVGAVGQPKVYNVRIEFEGEMRDRGKDWFKFTSEQYNFFDSPTRLFFMKAKVKGLPTSGYHKYTKEGAGMYIKVLSFVPVVDIDKPELFKTETVTFFNDLCLFAPAALIDKRINWETLNETSVKAIFTTNNIAISAILHFNEKGQLVNFVSEDRMAVDEMKTIPFSTPASKYQNMDGFNLPTYGEATWHYPDAEFVYGKFNVKSVEYNLTEFK